MPKIPEADPKKYMGLLDQKAYASNFWGFLGLVRKN